ncbi:MAG TPA: RNA polymerase Rpb4 family protein [Thermoplasmata archaeon]
MAEERHLSLADVKELLEREKGARPSLSIEQQYAFQHAGAFARLPSGQVAKLVKQLMEVPMMSEVNAMKIADLIPTHADDVRAIFAKERFALSKEDMDHVLEIVREYQ